MLNRSTSDSSRWNPSAILVRLWVGEGPAEARGHG
jgi:hypothetical protein